MKLGKVEKYYLEKLNWSKIKHQQILSLVQWVKSMHNKTQKGRKIFLNLAETTKKLMWISLNTNFFKLIFTQALRLLIALLVQPLRALILVNG